TRARDRLVLPARVVGERVKPAAESCPARWLLGALGLTDGVAADGADASAALTYAHDGVHWTATVTEAAEPAATDGGVATVERSAAAVDAVDAAVSREARLDPALLRRVAPVDVVPFGRRSATELMAFEHDRAAHRRQYVLGLRAEAVERPNATGDAGAAHSFDPRTIGDLVHQLLEADGGAGRDLGRDLDALLEREGMTWVPRAEVERVRRLVDATRMHPEVRRLLDGDAVERELPFTWFAVVDGTPHVLHGAMDVVARVADAARAGGGAIEVLDYKTNHVATGGEASVAARYATQRALYAAALAAVHAEPTAFSFFFPASGGATRHELDAAAVAAARLAIEARLRATGAAGAGGAE
ncbi:MAG TPA: PD-(D/E)XK nuclease family protein, partial [Gemmatirosa sp.]